MTSEEIARFVEALRKKISAFATPELKSLAFDEEAEKAAASFVTGAQTVLQELEKRLGDMRRREREELDWPLRDFVLGVAKIESHLKYPPALRDRLTATDFRCHENIRRLLELRAPSRNWWEEYKYWWQHSRVATVIVVIVVLLAAARGVLALITDILKLLAR